MYPTNVLWLVALFWKIHINKYRYSQYILVSLPVGGGCCDNFWGGSRCDQLVRCDKHPPSRCLQVVICGAGDASYCDEIWDHLWDAMWYLFASFGYPTLLWVWLPNTIVGWWNICGKSSASVVWKSTSRWSKLWYLSNGEIPKFIKIPKHGAWCDILGPVDDQFLKENTEESTNPPFKANLRNFSPVFLLSSFSTSKNPEFLWFWLSPALFM